MGPGVCPGGLSRSSELFLGFAGAAPPALRVVFTPTSSQTGSSFSSSRFSVTFVGVSHFDLGVPRGSCAGSRTFQAPWTCEHLPSRRQGLDEQREFGGAPPYRRLSSQDGSSCSSPSVFSLSASVQLTGPRLCAGFQRFSDLHMKLSVDHLHPPAGSRSS